MERTRQYRREVRNKIITKKKRICIKVYGYDWYKCDGKYSKGKIHCSCNLCKPKGKTAKNIKKYEREKSLIHDYNTGMN